MLPAYAAVVLATMLGRIELGKHWPVDTVGGVLAELIALRLVIALHAWRPRSAPVGLADVRATRPTGPLAPNSPTVSTEQRSISGSSRP